MSYGNIGIVLQSMGKLEEALVQHHKCLEIQIRVLGHEHLDVATSCNDIGEVYRHQGKYEEALVQHMKSLDIKKKFFSDEHPAVATSYYNMACVYAPRDEGLCRDMLVKAEQTGRLHELKEDMTTESDLDVLRELEWFKQLLLRLE